MEKFKKKYVWPKYDGSKITEYRRKNNLTMQEFADKVGVCLASVFNWETRGRGPRREKKEKLDKILDELEIR